MKAERRFWGVGMSACKLVGAANTPHIELLGAQPAAHSLTGQDGAARMAMQP